jgi:hypothetical protein
MFRIAVLTSAFLALSGTVAEAGDPFRGVPAPVIAYAQQFQGDCKSNKWGDVVPGEFYGLKEEQTRDLNGDGKPDYFVYKCMFGCSEKPSALEGRGTACPWGSLLLSDVGGHATIFLPGVVGRISAGPPIRVAITRPRALRRNCNHCAGADPGFDSQYVYELKAGRFQLIDKCPASGCGTLLGLRDMTSTP